MIILSIEGLDKAGKHTAMTTLKAQYERIGLTVGTMDFPDYTTPTGELIGQWLRGEAAFDYAAFELLLAADKQVGQQRILQHEARGVDVLIIDRYYHSQLAYGSVDNDPEWLESITKYLRKPDAVVYMSVSVEESMLRRGKHGDNDKYESDAKRLEHVKDRYETMLRSNGECLVEWVDANNTKDVVTVHVEMAGNMIYRKFKDAGRIG